MDQQYEVTMQIKISHSTGIVILINHIQQRKNTFNDSYGSGHHKFFIKMLHVFRKKKKNYFHIGF